MTDTTQDPTPVPTPPTDVTPAPSGASPAPSGTPPAADAAPADPAPAQTEGDNSLTGDDTGEQTRKPWYQTRIDALTREKWEARRQAEALQQQLASLQTARPEGQPPADPRRGAPQVPPTGNLPQDAIQREAQRIVAEREFNQKCNEVWTQGTKSIPGFKESIANFNMIGGLSENPVLLDAALASDNPAQVLHHLGSNLEEAIRIASLPPVKAAAEIVKMSMKMTAKPRAQAISSAPPPISPVGASSPGIAPGPDDSGKFASQEQYRRWREANFRRR